MIETSASLLERLRTPGDSGAWQRFLQLYSPLIYAWARRSSLQHQDADDLVQEVLGIIVSELPQFQYDRERGLFRGWLRTVTHNRLRAFWRSRQREVAAGDSAVESLLDRLADPHSDLSRLWDQEHDQHVAGRLLELIEPEFEVTTWRAFRRVVLDGADPAVAAAELGISRGAVYTAKCRVLQRLRQEIQGLLD